MEQEDKQKRYDLAYLKLAQQWSNLSYAKRRKVGALIVQDGVIISDGYNGTPTGFDNHCEDENGETFWYVLHAEANAITKVARTTQSAKGATLYITLSPCRECAKLILQTGIQRVVFTEMYRDQTGVEFLKNAGITIVNYA